MFCLLDSNHKVCLIHLQGNSLRFDDSTTRLFLPRNCKFRYNWLAYGEEFLKSYNERKAGSLNNLLRYGKILWTILYWNIHNNWRVAQPMITIKDCSFQSICRITFSLSQSQSQSFGTLAAQCMIHVWHLKYRYTIYTYNKNISVWSSIILQFSHTDFTRWFCYIFNPYTCSVTS